MIGGKDGIVRYLSQLCLGGKVKVLRFKVNKVNARVFIKSKIL